MSVSKPPPGRTSSLTARHSMGAGIHHRSKCSRTVQAFQIAAGGAFMNLEISSSERSVVIIFTPGHLVFDIVSESIDRGFPDSPLLGKPGFRGGQLLRFDVTGTDAAHLFRADQVALLKHPQMLHE